MTIDQVAKELKFVKKRSEVRVGAPALANLNYSILQTENITIIYLQATHNPVPRDIRDDESLLLTVCHKAGKEPRHICSSKCHDVCGVLF